jgi:hypothetical protein
MSIKESESMEEGKEKEGYSYLASPYAHKLPSFRHKRFEQICDIAGRLMARGMVVYSPIAQNHSVVTWCNIPLGKGWSWWKRFDEVMISHAKEVIVVKMEGWEDSVGIEGEIWIAGKLGIPVRYMEVSEVYEDTGNT